jgi:hypothetical protein
MKMELRPLPGISRQDQHTIEEINEILAKGVDRFAEFIRDASRKYMTLAEATREKLRTHANHHTSSFARALERVAARELHPRLAMTSGQGATTLARFDYKVQEKVVNDLVPVALPNGDHILKAFDDLSRDEVQQVFDTKVDPPEIRDIEGQKAWLAARKLELQRRARRERNEKLIVRKGSYKIQGSKFFPLKESYTARELQAIIADIERLKD